jgi:ribosomal protein S18 acetylase RimI-like enzyme
LDDNRILLLCVSPEHHGNGVGQHLLDHAKALCNVLTLEVHEKNTRAILFYLRNGFHDDAKPLKTDSCNERQKTMLWHI